VRKKESETWHSTLNEVKIPEGNEVKIPEEAAAPVQQQPRLPISLQAVQWASLNCWLVPVAGRVALLAQVQAQLKTMEDRQGAQWERLSSPVEALVEISARAQEQVRTLIEL